jgi:hypothetical protein
MTTKEQAAITASTKTRSKMHVHQAAQQALFFVLAYRSKQP